MKLIETFKKKAKEQLAKIPEVPYGLRRAFAEVANIPSAIAYLPSVPFATIENEDKLSVIGAVSTTAVLSLGLSFLPMLTLTLATPLYLAGRFMQMAKEDNAPLAHRIFKVD